MNDVRTYEIPLSFSLPVSVKILTKNNVQINSVKLNKMRSSNQSIESSVFSKFSFILIKQAIFKKKGNGK